MGEAKRRQHALAQWLTTLNVKERTVAEAALNVHDRLATKGGYVEACNFFALFMKKYLKQEHDIHVTPVFGWASYGEILFGHAWLDVDGKRVDFSLTQTSRPTVAPSGQLIILDQVVRPGAVYEYHPDTTDEIAAVAGLERVRFCEMMRAMAADDSAIDNYFASAAPEYQYDVVLNLLR